MADSEKTVSGHLDREGRLVTKNKSKSSITKDVSQAPPESPTTARPLDFDDEPQEAGGAGAQTVEGAPGLSKNEGTAPPKPPRPMDPREQATNTLKEAFPSIETSVIKAVLAASGYQVEPAFNALLGKSSPISTLLS